MSILDYFHFPQSSLLNKRIPKSQLQSQSKLSRHNQLKLYADIQDIYLVANITQSNSGIRETITEETLYYSIQYLVVTLKSTNLVSEIRQELHVLFPNPLMIEFNHQDQVLFSLALKRRSKSDSSKSVIEKYYDTNWFFIDEMHQPMVEHLNINHYKYKDLKDFYSQVLVILYSEVTIQLFGCYSVLSFNVIQTDLEDLLQLQHQITKLETSISGDLMMKDRMKLHQEILLKQQQYNNLLQIIKEA